MPAKPLTPEQKADAARLMGLFENQKAHESKQGKRLTQASLADDLGYATQSAVSQYLKGKVPLNVEAAMKFAARFECRVSEFSPSIQEEIDRIADFATKAEKDANMKKEARQLPIQTVEVATNKPPIAPKVDVGLAGAGSSQSWLIETISNASPKSKAAIHTILLPQDDRELLRESVEGRTVANAIETIEDHAIAAIAFLSERKKAKNGTKSN